MPTVRRCLRSKGIRVVTPAAGVGRGQPPSGAPRHAFFRYLFGVYSAFFRSGHPAYVRARLTKPRFLRNPSRPRRSASRAGRGRSVAPAMVSGGRRRNPKSAYPCENRRRINGESIPNKYRTNATGRASGPSTGDGGSGTIGRTSCEPCGSSFAARRQRAGPPMAGMRFGARLVFHNASPASSTTGLWEGWAAGGPAARRDR